MQSEVSVQEVAMIVGQQRIEIFVLQKEAAALREQIADLQKRLEEKK